MNDRPKVSEARSFVWRRVQYESALRVASPALALSGRVGAQVNKTKKLLGTPSGKSPRSSGKKLFGPALKTTGRLKEVLTEHYLSGRYADGAVPVAWVTSGFPVELLRPFGYHVVYPENHAAMCGVQHRGVELSKHAEEWGMPRETCGYVRTDVGSWLSGDTPVGRLPKPDILMACTNICQTVVYWYRTLGKLMNVPVFVIDTPFVYGEPDERAEEYVAEQLEACLHVAAKVAGKRYHEKKLREASSLSREASMLWGECLGTSKAKPAPWTGFEQFLHLGPIVASRGLPVCNRYYEALLAELEERVKQGIAAVPGEKHRLLWDNLPVWFELRSMSKLLAAEGFNIVSATYTNGWYETAPLFDPNDPIRSAAKVYSRVFLNRDVDYRLAYMKELAADFSCDGAILHSDHSCKPYSAGQVDLGERLSQEAGIRTLLLDADHIDERVYSKEQGEGRISAFMESFGEQ